MEGDVRGREEGMIGLFSGLKSVQLTVDPSHTEMPRRQICYVTKPSLRQPLAANQHRAGLQPKHDRVQASFTSDEISWPEMEGKEGMGRELSLFCLLMENFPLCFIAKIYISRVYRQLNDKRRIIQCMFIGVRAGVGNFTRTNRTSWTTREC
jgi:hypothetical protein